MPAENPHARAPVACRGARLPDAALAVIALHGRELGAASMIEIVERLAAPGVAFVVPEADARSWYPASFLAPAERNAERLAHALARVDELVAAAAPVPTIVLGFSQGACLALEWLSRTARPIAGVIAFTGGLIGPPGTAWPATPLSTPVLITTSDIDDWVPIARVRESAEVLAARGAPVDLRVLVGRPHVVDDRELAAARAVIDALLP